MADPFPSPDGLPGTVQFTKGTDVRVFLRAYDRGLVRTNWRNSVASYVRDLEAENNDLRQQLADALENQPDLGGNDNDTDSGPSLG